MASRAATRASTALIRADEVGLRKNVSLRGLPDMLDPELGGLAQPLHVERCQAEMIIPLGLAAHLGTQLPLLVRGAYYDRWQPSEQPKNWRSLDEFLAILSTEFRNLRPVDPNDAARCVFQVLNYYIDPGQAGNVRDALPRRGAPPVARERGATRCRIGRLTQLRPNSPRTNQ
jgi:hypothetical protein